MKTLTEHLGQYAIYHRDERNIYTHFVGVPLIVIAVIWLLYIPVLTVESVVLTPALFIIFGLSLYYIWLEVKLGCVMAGLLAAGYLSAQLSYMHFSGIELWFYMVAFSIFFIGWVIQFIGHYFEGKKPAFVDDLMGLIIGPLFVVSEFAFKLGFLKSLEIQVIDIAGPYKKQRNKK